MHLVKKLALGLFSSLFIFLLFATAFDIGFVRTTTHPGTVKRLISESGLYDSLVPNVLQQNKTISTSVGNISTTDPAIQKAVTAAITPDQVKRQTEGAIDNIYQWLDGAVSQPTFNIDFSSSKGSLATNIAGVVQQKAAALPACTPEQSAAIAQSANFDAVNANCLPFGLSAAALADQVRSSLNSNNGFISQAQVSANQVKGSNNQSFFGSDTAKQIPKQYQRAKKTPLILSILTILCGLAVVFLSSSWQKGLRHIGINLAVIGVVMLVVAWGLNRAVSTKIAPKISLDNLVLQQDIRNLVTDIGQQVAKNYYFFGGVYTVLGAGSLAAVAIANKRNRSVLPSPKDQTAP